MENNCRICLKTDMKDLLSLHFYDCTINKTYFQMYQYVSGVVPCNNTKFLCNICVDALKAAFLFKEKIETNEKMFNNLLGSFSDNIKENENDDAFEQMIIEPSIDMMTVDQNEDDMEVKQEVVHYPFEATQWSDYSNKDDEREVIQCVLCSYNTSKKCNFQKHVVRVHKRLKMRCDGCHESFHLIYILEKHRQIDHGFFHKYTVDESLKQANVELKLEELAVIECPLCDYKSTSKDNYGKHVKRTHNRENLQCDGCEESFHLVHVLNQHRRVKHGYLHRYKVVLKKSST